MAKLKVLESEESGLVGKEFEIAGDESWIGRAPDGGVYLPDAAISRRHAHVEVRADGHFLVDNGSANGTFLNGQRVTRAALKEGDKVRVGRTVLEIRGLPDLDGTLILENAAAVAAKPGDLATVVNYEAATEPVRDVPARRPAPQAPPPPAKAPPAPPAAPAARPAVPPPPPAARPAAPAPPPEPVRARGPAAAPPPVPATARPAPPPPAARPAAAPVRMAPPPPAAAAAPRATLAGFWIRFAAYLVDSVILGAVLVPLFLLAGMFLVPSSSTPGAAMGGVFLLQLVVTAISVAYVLYFWSTSGATPGKKVLRLKIVRVDGVHPLGLGTAGMRLVGYLASGAILCIGYLMIGFSAEKRGLHDLIAKTRVIRLG